MRLDILIGDKGFRSDFNALGLTTPLRLELHTTSPPEDGYFPDRWSLLPARAAGWATGCCPLE